MTNPKLQTAALQTTPEPWLMGYTHPEVPTDHRVVSTNYKADTDFILRWEIGPWASMFVKRSMQARRHDDGVGR